MKLKVDKSEGYDWSIVVDEKELRRLDEIIKNAFNDSQEATTLEYNINCSDGTLIEIDDINEVVSEENPKNHQIEFIGISARNKKSSKKISVSLGKEHWHKIIFYSISGDSRDWVYLTASKIEERIKNFKEWYSIIPKFDIFWIYFSIFFLGTIFYLKDLTNVFIKYFPIPQNTAAFVTMFIIVGILYIIHQLTKKPYQYLFPSVVFRIGDGIKRHDRVVKLRGQIFWGVIVSLIVSIISGLIILKGTS